MADIFVSYSRKDLEQALSLVERLRAAGFDVWIDKHGIEGANSWSKEIANALESASIFLLLLSESSVASPNVSKELGVATLLQKRIVPLRLERVELRGEFLYHLANLQYVRFEEFDALVSVLNGKPTARGITPAKSTDDRKSLMILPFEDLSPTGDNDWFADGLASELIGTLSNIKALKLIDWNTSREFKNNRVRTTTLAKEFSVRYFIEGQVRKFGDQIKISVTLLDISTGDHLWQDSLKGTMADIFDIQEEVAKKVLDGLAVILSSEEEKELDKKPTVNAEAYEMWLKAREYFSRQTKSDFERALSLYESAVRLDPTFATAFAGIANTCQTLYRNYDRNGTLLDRAEAMAMKVKDLEGETARYYWAMSMITLQRGDRDAALHLAKRAVETDPYHISGYEALGHAYKALGMKEETVKAREEVVRLQENDRTYHFSRLIALYELGDRARIRAAAEQALPIFERYSRLNPDDYYARVSLANIYSMNGDTANALSAADEVSLIETLDGVTHYNLACVYLKCNMTSRAIEHLRRSVGKGLRNIEQFRRDPDLAPLRGLPEFEELIRDLEGASNQPIRTGDALHPKH